jgi:hypothetical protein
MKGRMKAAGEPQALDNRFSENGMMLLDEWLPADPAPAAVERHAMHVRAPSAAVYAALWRADLAGPIGRVLLGLRVLPAALGGSRAARDRLSALWGGSERLTLQGFVDLGFTMLGEQEEREIVLGLTGKFWKLGGSIAPTAAATFRHGPPRGYAQAAWNFALTPATQGGPGGTWLTTETRVRCGDKTARRCFGAYWLLVRPFSGLLRRVMLRSIRREAERQPGAAAR